MSKITITPELIEKTLSEYAKINNQIVKEFANNDKVVIKKLTEELDVNKQKEKFRFYLLITILLIVLDYVLNADSFFIYVAIIPGLIALYRLTAIKNAKRASKNEALLKEKIREFFENSQEYERLLESIQVYASIPPNKKVIENYGVISAVDIEDLKEEAARKGANAIINFSDNRQVVSKTSSIGSHVYSTEVTRGEVHGEAVFLVDVDVKEEGKDD
ncbi:hypothetical protein [Caminibacter pacificus]|uniref:Uncharacterized protein n=1 Tax=Caminibacter pacificus TaxID=1424653 RepID=A0AAJ4RAW6_9BACT|nr:hypothetical protein [Caminibacter pacificus]QDD68177.1 hypothetical protein C6V80_10000 [Caminibacter pacificus]ROR38690.1 hypothetical protein EDC58_1905 [Caminibacter pacificus]